jgi:hypothetical protein
MRARRYEAEDAVALDHSLVGVPGERRERSWASKDALLYAAGAGAGRGHPLRECSLSRQNSLAAAGGEPAAQPVAG